MRMSWVRCLALAATLTVLVGTAFAQDPLKVCLNKCDNEMDLCDKATLAHGGQKQADFACPNKLMACMTACTKLIGASESEKQRPPSASKNVK
jgi:hypothetical protein